jgi:hypothetical protein
MTDVVVARYVIGATWSLAMIMVGAWLSVSPWALGQQASGGGWTAMTDNLVATGLAIAALGLIGFVGVLAVLIGDLRAAGILPRRRHATAPPAPEREPEPQPQPAAPSTDEVLAQLARVLAEELGRHSAERSDEGARPRVEPAREAEA